MSESDKGAPAPPPETEPRTEARPEPPRTLGGIPVASRPEPPRLRHDDRVLPSGLHVGIRMFVAGDFDRMLNEERRPSKAGPITILQECVTEIKDPGPYQLSERGGLDWTKVAQVDVMSLVVWLRRLSRGNEYDFTAKCPHQGCGKPIHWTIECDELEYSEMHPEGIRSIESGEEMKFTLPLDGREILHHILTTAEANKIGLPGVGAQKKEWVVAALDTRISEIQGVPGNDKRWWLRQLGSEDQDAIIDEIDRLEGGHVLDFPIDCGNCTGEVMIKISDTKDFLVGGRRTKSSGR